MYIDVNIVDIYMYVYIACMYIAYTVQNGLVTVTDSLFRHEFQKKPRPSPLSARSITPTLFKLRISYTYITYQTHPHLMLDMYPGCRALLCYCREPVPRSRVPVPGSRVP